MSRIPPRLPLTVMSPQHAAIHVFVNLLPALLLISCGGNCLARDRPERLNRFNDPFFQISDAIRRCPVPAGPFITEEEARVQTHHRAERGTSCWLSGECDRPNDYAYDAEIARAIKLAFQNQEALKKTSLWVTVQGRVVYIEGCAVRKGIASRVEAIVRAIPNVKQAIALVYSGTTSRPPYKRLEEDRPAR